MLPALADKSCGLAVKDPDALASYGKFVMDASLKTIRERQNALKIGPPVSMPLMQAASEYRTGLQIFWLANLALRLRNLGMAELGRHLTESDP